MSPAGHPTGDRYTRTFRLLVVDSDAGSRQLYRECLKPIGCDVIDATDGRDALVRALVHRPSLVITDARLPVFDGYQLLDLLKRDVTTREVPILLVTSDSRDTDLKRAGDSGADSVLVKPVTPEALLREVTRLLQHAANGDRPPAADAPPRRPKRTTVMTTTPPAVPPSLLCPTCDRPLNYEHSHVGGVRKQAEQWDTFTCPSCGSFEYRQRTRKLRRPK